MGRKRYTQRVKLMDRDTQVFAMIGKRGCVSLEAIRRNFWPHCQPGTTTCEDRIEQLKRAGYISSEIVDVRGRQEKIYYLDRKGRMEFDEETRKSFYKRCPPMNEMRHALNMGDILDAFASKVVSFTNEHQLKSISSLQSIPDAEVADAHLTIEDGAGNQQSFYVEVDGTYHGQRLTNKIAQIAAAGKPILWVSWSMARVQHIAQLSRNFQNIVPIHFHDLGNI